MACQEQARAEQAAAAEHARLYEAQRRAHPRRPADFKLVLSELAAWQQQACTAMWLERRTELTTFAVP